MAKSVVERMSLFRFLCIGALSVASQCPASAQAANDNDPITLKTVLPDIGRDQIRIYWKYPKSLAHRHELLPTIAFVAAAGVLIAADQYESPYFRRTTAFGGFNTAFSARNSSLLTAGVPVTTYLVGLLRKDAYAKSTALRTAEAVADSELTAEFLKLATQRARPRNIQPNGNFGDTWADSPTVAGGSFPSGHTIAAFSVATVMARRYGRDRKWVPFVAYGLAATIGFSRVTLSAHNVSDVFVGAGLGYAISRFVALRQRH